MYRVRVPKNFFLETREHVKNVSGESHVIDFIVESMRDKVGESQTFNSTVRDSVGNIRYLIEESIHSSYHYRHVVGTLLTLISDSFMKDTRHQIYFYRSTQAQNETKYCQK